MVIVFNPVAGRRRASLLWRVLDVLVANGVRLDLAETLWPGHAEALAREAVSNGEMLVVAAGGDGTIAEVANGLMGSPARLGVIPLGTANVLAHELALPFAPRAVAAALAFGRTRVLWPGLAEGAALGRPPRRASTLVSFGRPRGLHGDGLMPGGRDGAEPAGPGSVNGGSSRAGEDSASGPATGGRAGSGKGGLGGVASSIVAADSMASRNAAWKDMAAGRTASGRAASGNPVAGSMAPGSSGSESVGPGDEGSERVAAGSLLGRNALGSAPDVPAATTPPERRLFVQMLGVGFDAQVVHSLPTGLKRVLGKGAYVLQTLNTLLRYDYPTIPLRIDGHETSAASVVISKGVLYGGTYRLAPDARSDTPGFSVVLFDHGGPGAALLYGMALPLNLLQGGRGVRHIRAERIDFIGNQRMPVQTDGDAAGFAPLSVTAAPAPIQVVAG